MWILGIIYGATVLFSYYTCANSQRIYCLSKGLSFRLDWGDVVYSLIPLLNVAMLPLYLELDGVKDEIRAVERKANAIGMCPNCRRYSRKYQTVLYKLDARINGNNVGCCPHCDAITNVYHSGIIDDEHPWQENHPDCPKLSKRGVIEYLKTKRDIEAIVAQMESFESLERYEKTRRKRNEQH